MYNIYIGNIRVMRNGNILQREIRASLKTNLKIEEEY